MAPGESITGSQNLPARSVFVAAVELAIAIPTTTTTTAAASPTAATTAATAVTTAAATTATTVAAAAFTPASAAPGTPAATSAAIERDDVLGLRTLLTLTHLELDFLAFLELAEPAALDRGEVHEAILATIIRRDETVALLSVKPLHYPCRAHRALSPLALCS
jgi:hypothetical protein